MGTFVVGGRVYEVTGIGPVAEPGFHYECSELTPDGPGYLGKIVCPADDGPSEVLFDFEQPVPLAVLQQWIKLIPELRSGVLLAD